jgi:hypothetical protein
MNKWFKIILIVMVSLGLFSRCNVFESDSTSASVLVIEVLADSAGETPIFSNVGSLVNDLCQATLTARLIDPAATDGTYYESIIVDQIDVEFSRSDGLSQEGKDIPFAFSQKVNQLIGIGDTVELPFTIIQHTAKVEPPLVDLVDGGEEEILKLEAKVTFYGKDVGGHRIAPVVGSVSVWCGPFSE